MKILTKAFALLLAGVMIFSFAACHEKDEIAVTVKNGEQTEEFTSAFYLYALMTADNEAYEKASAQLTDSGVKEEDITEKKLYAQKLDGKSYVDWTHARAKEIVAEMAAYKIKCDQNKLTLDKDTVANLETQVQQYWTGYGYQSVYETNGVSYETFKKAMTYPAYSTRYFDFIYGEGGEKEVPEKDILTAMEKNFEIANVISVDLSELKDDEVKKNREKLDGYVKKLKKGTPFSEIYNDYYNIKEDATTSSGASSSSSSAPSSSADATSSEVEKEEKLEPKDLYATLLGSKDTESYANDNFDTVKAMKKGEIKIVEDKEKKTLTLLVRGDIMADEYWTTNLNSVTLDILKGDEFKAEMDKVIEKLDVKVSKDAISAFDVKDLYKYSK